MLAVLMQNLKQTVKNVILFVYCVFSSPTAVVLVLQLMYALFPYLSRTKQENQVSLVDKAHIK